MGKLTSPSRLVYKKLQVDRYDRQAGRLSPFYTEGRKKINNNL